VEYKKEAYGLFNELNSLIQKEVVYSIYKVADVQNIMAPNLLEMARNFMAPAKEGENNPPSPLYQGGVSKIGLSAEVQRAKVGRNDPCPCGSGKKYKKCCGK
jgi:preprotein translocase subunit SecA